MGIDEMISREELIQQIKELQKKVSEIESKNNDGDGMGNSDPINSDHFKEIFNVINIGIIFVNKIGTVVDLNPALCKMIDIPRSKIVGKSAMYLAKKLLTGKDLLRCLKVIPASLAGKDIEPFELRYNNKILEISAPFSKSTTLETAIISDVTNKRKIAMALQKSENRYKAIFENTGAATIIFEADMLISHANKKAAELSGFSIDEIIGKKRWTEFIHEDDLEKMKRYHELRRKDPSSAPSQYEFKFKRKDGMVRNILLTVDTIADSGRGVASLLDITELKKSEISLRNNEKFIRAVVENSPLGVSVRNRQGKLLLYNEAWKEIWGHTNETIRDEMERERPSLTFDEKDEYLEDWTSKVKRIYEEGGQLFVPDRLVPDPREGGARWVSQRFYSIAGSDGAVDRVVILTDDITERKEIQMELMISENRYGQLYKGMRDGVCVYQTVDGGKDFIFKDINPAGEKIGNVVKENIVGKSIFEIRPNIEEYGLVDAFRRAYETGEPVHHTEKFYADDNLQGWFDNFVYRLDTGEVIAIFTDNTEKQRAERAIRESEQRYRGLFETMADGAYQTTPDGTILSANNALQKMLGYNSQKEPLRDINVKDIYTDPELRTTLLEQLEREGEIRGAEISLIRKDGREIIVMENSQAVKDNDGKVIRFEGILTDITERKRAEQVINYSLKEKDILLKEIHHRVKNNMQIISSLLDLQADNVDDPNLSEKLSVSRKRIKTMALIHETLYRSDNLGSIEASEYLINLTQYLASVNPDFSVEPEIDLQVEEMYLPIDTAIPIGLIITELVTNAQKYAFKNNWSGEDIGQGASDQKDKEILPVIEVVLREWKSEGRYELVVADNGIGLPPEFDQENTKTLGLQLVSMLVQQLKGTIDVQRDNGTSYHIMVRKRDTSTIGDREKEIEQF